MPRGRRGRYALLAERNDDSGNSTTSINSRDSSADSQSSDGGGSDDSSDGSGADNDASRALVAGQGATTVSTPLPRMRIFVLFLMLLADGIALQQIFPYAAFMVRDFAARRGGEMSKEDVGYAVGWLATCYSASQFASSFVWGYASDRFGRRPVILLGLTGTFVCSLGFGFSTSLGVALLWRSLNGLANGNIGVAKTVLAEITDDTNKAQGFSILGVSAGVGRMLGMLVGGLLYDPASKYDLFAVGMFRTFPNLLPCLVAACLNFAGLVIGVLVLHETLQRPRGEAFEMDAIKDSTPTNAVPKSPSSVEEGLPLRLSAETSTRSRWSVVLHDRQVWISTMLYGLLALTFIAFDEVFPLLVILDPADGGLGFRSEDIGLVTAAAAFCFMAFQLLVYPKIAKHFGPLRSFRLGLYGALPLISVFSFIGPFRRITTAAATWVVIIAMMVVRMCCSITAFTSTFLLVANSVVPEYLGTVNGLGQSLAAFARTIGPASSASLFAASLKWGGPFPLNYHFVYVILVALTVGNILLSWLLPASINTSRESMD